MATPQALLVNTPAFEKELPLPEELVDVPYDTPVVTCWVPGSEHTARQLGVVRYLVKPVTREVLLSSLEALGDGVETVLLVDDEPEVLQLFARIISSSQRRYQVLRAKSGKRALSLLRKRRPDVLLLDLIMPEMDGFDVLREKSEDPSIRDIPVIIISSRDPAGEAIAARSLTVTRHSGLSLRDLILCIDAVSRILCPSARPAGRGRPEMPVG